MKRHLRRCLRVWWLRFRKNKLALGMAYIVGIHVFFVLVLCSILISNN
jgi:hypothetical protein